MYATVKLKSQVDLYGNLNILKVEFLEWNLIRYNFFNSSSRVRLVTVDRALSSMHVIYRFYYVFNRFFLLFDLCFCEYDVITFVLSVSLQNDVNLRHKFTS